MRHHSQRAPLRTIACWLETAINISLSLLNVPEIHEIVVDTDLSR
jgi:hypothetical protein